MIRGSVPIGISMKTTMTIMTLFFFIAPLCNGQIQRKIVSKGSVDKIDKTLLTGIWGVSKDENASFQFKKDYVYYIDSNTKLKYTLKGNVLTYYENNAITFKEIILKLDQDSLVLKDSELEEINRFVRLNKK
jgi:hypothetical protein